jgi:hypothetical protein
MTPTRTKSRRALLAPLLGAALLLAACGSSGPEPTVTVTGSVFAAPVSGAAVTVRDAGGAAVAGPVTSSATGAFSVEIPASQLARPLFVEATGGTFTDEASAAPTAAGTLLAHAAAGTLSAGSSVHLTPQSAMVAHMVQHGLAPEAAQAAFRAAFGFAPDAAVAPANVAVTAGGDTAPALAALRAGAFSQLARDLGVPAASQFDLIGALAQDAADGALDGQEGTQPLSVGGVSLPADVQNRFSAALLAWRASAGNLTGLKVDQIGAPPFAKVALTPSYRVEYLPGTMPATAAKTRFRVRITDRTSGAAAPALAVGLQPVMHMSTKSHGAPVDPVVDLGDGSYACTAYYVMASMMADGTSMGVWALAVAVGGPGGETATFYPPVGMAMGTTTQLARLSGGAADQIQMMPSPVARTYQLFNDGLTLAGADATFNVLVTTMDTMMSFPHLSPGATLHDGTGAAFPVTAVGVQVSSDDGATWRDATDLGDGHWSATGLAGLAAGVARPLRVGLSVNGVTKSLADGSASHATFTVTP